MQQHSIRSEQTCADLEQKATAFETKRAIDDVINSHSLIQIKPSLSSKSDIAPPASPQFVQPALAPVYPSAAPGA